MSILLPRFLVLAVVACAGFCSCALFTDSASAINPATLKKLDLAEKEEQLKKEKEAWTAVGREIQAKLATSSPVRIQIGPSPDRYRTVSVETQCTLAGMAVDVLHYYWNLTYPSQNNLLLFPVEKLLSQHLTSLSLFDLMSFGLSSARQTQAERKRIAIGELFTRHLMPLVEKSLPELYSRAYEQFTRLEEARDQYEKVEQEVNKALRAAGRPELTVDQAPPDDEDLNKPPVRRLFPPTQNDLGLDAALVVFEWIRSAVDSRNSQPPPSNGSRRGGTRSWGIDIPAPPNRPTVDALRARVPREQPGRGVRFIGPPALDLTFLTDALHNAYEREQARLIAMPVTNPAASPELFTSPPTTLQVAPEGNIVPADPGPPNNSNASSTQPANNQPNPQISHLPTGETVVPQPDGSFLILNPNARSVQRRHPDGRITPF